MPKSLVALVVLIWPVLSLAQGAPPPTTAAANAAVEVPPMRYRSAFDATPPSLAQGTESWKAANAAVGQFPRGHRDVYKWEKAHERATGAMPPAAAEPAASPPHMH